jgi:hypothetical protein
MANFVKSNTIIRLKGKDNYKSWVNHVAGEKKPHREANEKANASE